MIPAAAVLLKAPRVGLVKTRLAAEIGPERAAALYRALAEKTVSCVRGVEWPITVWFAPDDAEVEMREWLGPDLRYRAQPPGALGARLQHAVAGAKPGRPIVLLGGDCPGLDTGILDTARRKLSGPDMVLGPCLDGGYYLLGGWSPFPDLFSGMPWSTDQVLEETRQRMRRHPVAWHELPTLRDVDTAADARALGLIEAGGPRSGIHHGG